MSRKVTPYTIPESDLIELERRIRSRNISRKENDRTYIVIESSKGRQPSEIAKELRTYANKVIFWRKAYQAKGLAGLDDSLRSGRSVIYDEIFKDRVLKKISDTPPDGYARWDAPLLSEELNCSVDAIWRLLKERRHPFKPTAQLVHQHRQEFCRQGCRYCRIIFSTTGKCDRYLCG